MKGQTKRKISYIPVCIMVFLMFGIVFGYAGCRFIRHERSQNTQIAELSSKISFLETKVRGTPEADLFVKKCAENTAREGYNYLAIGNSITKHGLTDYWWSEYGMAASEPEKDYFHRVVTFLEDANQGKTLYSMAYSFSIWETLATDRAQTLELLDRYLNDYVNIVTVQLGENASNLTTFESDFKYLLEHIKEHCPKAQVIVVGDFWENGGRDEMKKRAAAELGVGFVDLSAIKDNKEYMAGLGISVYGDDGKQHEIKHDGVAAHPGDSGMEYIAQKIFGLIRNEYGGDAE